jgi:hypothetical protein
MLAIVLAVTALEIGCNKADSSAVSSAPKESSGEHHDMSSLPPTLDAFHKLLAPLWHAPAGDQRMTDTCAGIPGFQTAAAAVGSAAVPGAAALAGAVTKLADACAATPRDGARFDAAFAAVHDAFHGALGEK